MRVFYKIINPGIQTETSNIQRLCELELSLLATVVDAGAEEHDAATWSTFQWQSSDLVQIYAGLK